MNEVTQATNLGYELMTQPEINENVVQRLAEIASHLDGGDETEDSKLLQEFNRLANTNFSFSAFQGIYGAEDHIDYVRRLLITNHTTASPDSGRNDLISMFQKVLDNPADETYTTFVFTTIEKTFGDTQVSDLVFWPGEYLGDGNHSRELSSEEMADIVLSRYEERKSQ